MRTWSRCLPIGAAALSMVVLAACGSSGSDDKTTSAASSTAAAKPASAGGVACIPPAPTNMPKDPDGVVAGLTGAAKAGMGGYPGTVYKSPWVTFKSKHGPPWKIGMSNNEGNLNAQDVLRGLKAGAAANPGKVSKIVSTTPSTPNDVATQIQQTRSLLQQNVDIIFSTLGSPTALNGVIDQAAKQGVPVISILGQSTSKNAVNLQPNPIQLGYY
jgi:ribose transport system substrate-binding protein